MAESNAFVVTFLLAIAAPASLAFSSRSWYCHRLVPQFITSSVTPCRYPCLVVSSHEHPYIVVQNEPDGTPCMLPNAFHHGAKIAHCRSSVCVEEVPQKLLKRKKRFICLYALGRIIHLRKQRTKLKEEIEQLRRQLADSRNTDLGNEGESGSDSSVNAGAERFGGGITGPDGGEASGPENAGGVGSGTGSLDVSGRGGGAPALPEAVHNGLGIGRSPGGEIDTLGGPRNPNYRGGFNSPGDDGADSAGQVRLRENGGARVTGTTGFVHEGNIGGTSGNGEFDSPVGAIERGGGGEAGYWG